MTMRVREKTAEQDTKPNSKYRHLNQAITGVTSYNPLKLTALDPNWPSERAVLADHLDWPKDQCRMVQSIAAAVERRVYAPFFYACVAL